MRIEVRPADRLRGPESAGLLDSLTTIAAALSASTIDLSLVRVVGDWIQYRSNFREVAALRLVVPATGHAEVAEPTIELAVDLRRCADVDLRALVPGLLAEHASPQPSARCSLEPWVAGTASCIWRFNTLYWQALSDWGHATRREYERSVPGGQR